MRSSESTMQSSLEGQGKQHLPSCWHLYRPELAAAASAADQHATLLNDHAKQELERCWVYVPELEAAAAAEALPPEAAAAAEADALSW